MRVYNPWLIATMSLLGEVAAGRYDTTMPAWESDEYGLTTVRELAAQLVKAYAAARMLSDSTDLPEPNLDKLIP